MAKPKRWLLPGKRVGVNRKVKKSRSGAQKTAHQRSHALRSINRRARR